MNWKNRYAFGALFIGLFIVLNRIILVLYLYLLSNIIQIPNNLELVGVFFLIPCFIFMLIIDLTIWRIAIKKIIGIDRFGEYTGSLFFLIFLYYVYTMATPFISNLINFGSKN